MSNSYVIAQMIYIFMLSRLCAKKNDAWYSEQNYGYD